VGARTIELNNVEYLIRGRGFLRSLDDIAKTVIKSVDGTPVTVAQIGTVGRGPALRRGVLDKDGAEAVGGVAVVRHGANPLAVIKNVRAKVAEIAPGLPARAVLTGDVVPREEVEAFAAAQGFAAFHGGALNQEGWTAWLRETPRGQWPAWITLSRVTVVPFYDRTGLIMETLGTLRSAIELQILITVIVVIIMMAHLRSSLLISSVLPAGVLMSFIGMKLAGVDANIVALSGIAIAIGTMVDMGVVMCENILRRLDEADADADRFTVVFDAAREVGGAVLTAVATTVVGFLPVFTMTGAEGKLFVPLAYTKTFALIASVILAITVIPVLARFLLAGHVRGRALRVALLAALAMGGVAVWAGIAWWAGAILLVMAAYHALNLFAPGVILRAGRLLGNGTAVLAVGTLLTLLWMPLGPARGFTLNALFVGGLIAGLLGLFRLFQWFYPRLLAWFLDHKAVYLALPACTLVFGGMVWLGADSLLGFLPDGARQTRAYAKVYHAFPGLGKEFMPPLDEGSFLWMPTTMPHASLGEVIDVLAYQDQAFAAIPEVDTVVGKAGRVDSPLDPAPISMIETVILYKPEYVTDESGARVRFRYDRDRGEYARDAAGALIPDPAGRPYRQWRDEIRSPDDIWAEIVEAGRIPGTTSAPKLQPIMARIVMLQSGMRAPMGVKVRGPNLQAIEEAAMAIEGFLKQVPGVNGPAVFAERVVGKPYLEIDIDRDAIARYGISVRQVQDVIEAAIGGHPITTTVEGRERYPVRVRYQRELRDEIESLGRILVPAPEGRQIPIDQLAVIRYVRGPQMIKSEDTFLVAYVTFDKQDGYAEVDVVESCQRYLESKLDSGAWVLPAGVSYTFAGNYENQLRAQKTLRVVLPLALFIIFLILYLQFRNVPTTLIVFSGIAVAWAGGFVLIWFYAQPWFLDFAVAGVNMRELFQVREVLLSVAIWVGFLALFGIASDDGVVMATYLDQSFAANPTQTPRDIRAAVVEAGTRRIRPCLITTATTILALLPVLTSTGRGADIMIPMAIPTFGGMLIALMTLFLVPVLYCAVAETRLAARKAAAAILPEGV
jgi:Cu(I)/Ag(I) efflux system membrane protein CusA/SilA